MLTPWEGNPNVGDKEKVAASIKRFGFVAPICVWTSKGRMVAGHTRLAAFFVLLDRDAKFVPRGAPGPGLVPVRFHEFESEAEADAYALADNQLERLSHTDDAKLAAALERIRAMDKTLPKIAGFDDKAIEAIRARARQVSFTAHDKDPDEVPDPPKVVPSFEAWPEAEQKQARARSRRRSCSAKRSRSVSRASPMRRSARGSAARRRRRTSS
jgi:ParB-like chromosome segregation protein Spo0J